MNDPNHPEWGSWAGRYGAQESSPGKPYFWANRTDAWRGSTNRDNTLGRWAVDLQNDFRARLDWCVKPFAQANHPPMVRVRGGTRRDARQGETVTLDVSESSDPDGQRIGFEWFVYREAGNCNREVLLENANSNFASFTAPLVSEPVEIHLIAAVRDQGEPPLTRYARIIVTIKP
jgi:hypothetical protein